MYVEMLDEAVLKAFKHHGEQKRKFSDELYVNHCLRVASLVGDYADDEELVSAAILHDIVEDTKVTIKDVEAWFGKRVASLVKELTNSRVGLAKLGKREYIYRKFNTISPDALIIKLLDRLDNLTGLINSNAPIAFVRKYVKDTDYVVEEIDRELLEVHKTLLYNLAFINNYIAITILR
jgi:(p)ppGpp synthase/HD superfamily hydrolase